MGDSTFDRWLETELGRALNSVDPGYVAPRYLARRPARLGRRRLGLLAGGPAAVGAKLLTAGIALAAATSTGVAVGSVVTQHGSSDPLTWGAQVVQQVDKCKAELGTDQHGIGQCVSQFAKQHGDAVSDQHGDSTSTPDAGDSTSTPNGGQSDSHPTPNGGRSDSHPTPNGGRSDSHPTPNGGNSNSHPTPNRGNSNSHPTPNGGNSGNAPAPPSHPTPRLGTPSSGSQP